MATRPEWVVRGLIAGAVAGLLALCGVFEGWERLSLDARTYLCARFCRQGAEVPITVVAIDDAALAAVGRWPWPRATLAVLLERITRAGALVVAVDIILAEPGPGDAQLAEALRLVPTVLPVYGEGRERVTPLPLLAAIAEQGHIELQVDRDGVVRSIPGQRAGELPFGVKAARLWRSRPGDLPPPGQRVWLDMRLKPGARRLAVHELTTTISAADAMAGEASWGSLAGRLVLVGLTAAGTAGSDAHITSLRPLGFVPGVYIHAAVARAELLGRHLRRVGPGLGLLLALAGGVATGLLVAGPVGGLVGTPPLVIAALLLAGYGAVVFTAFASLAVWLPVVGPAVAIAGTAGWAAAYRRLAVEQERRTLRRLFSRYVPADLLPELIARSTTLGLAGVHRDVAVLFADVRGFSALAEPLPPARVFEVLNLYLEAMAQCVREHGGMVDKYLGDGLMAVFGAPIQLDNPAAAALRCALAMQEKVALLQPPTGVAALPGIGIGVHVGEAAMGTVGGRERLEYTAMGDVVNVAARLEELAAPGTVLLSAEVWARAGGENWCRKPLLPLGAVPVRGRSSEVLVYQLGCCDGGH